jgi:hypothetical protein
LEDLLESCDIDKDGKFDYFLTNTANANEVNTYRNTGNATFNLLQSNSFTVGNIQNPPLKFTDINDDGFTDALYRNIAVKGMFYRPNDGTGLLQAPTLIDSTYLYTYLNADDLDNDNRSEIIWAKGIYNGKKYIGYLKKAAPSAISNKNLDLVQISLYPNPVENILHIKVGDNAIINNVKIIDINGKVMYANKNLPSQININDWAKGEYFLIIGESSFGFEKK